MLVSFSLRKNSNLVENKCVDSMNETNNKSSMLDFLFFIGQAWCWAYTAYSLKTFWILSILFSRNVW